MAVYRIVFIRIIGCLMCIFLTLCRRVCCLQKWMRGTVALDVSPACSLRGGVYSVANIHSNKSSSWKVRTNLKATLYMGQEVSVREE
jgi:hypothetical protein